MNWEAVAAIAELAGAVAVIVSIVYLAAQVKNTAKQLQAQAEDSTLASAFDAFTPVYEGRNAEIFRLGLSNPEVLDANDLFVFNLLLDRQRGVFASIVRRQQTGTLNSELAHRMIQGYRYLFLETAGGRLWLKGARDRLSELELKALQ